MTINWDGLIKDTRLTKDIITLHVPNQLPIYLGYQRTGIRTSDNF